jgi:hypothetical protein
LLKKIAKATTIDKFTIEVKASITNRSHESKRVNLGRFTFQDNLLFRDNLLYIPKGPCSTKVLQKCHDNLLVDHFGVHLVANKINGLTLSHLPSSPTTTLYMCIQVLLYFS